MGEAGLSAAEVGKEISEHRHHSAGGEAQGHDRVITIIEAILLAIVALLAAWSGFASSKWSTESRLDLAEASTARTEANRALGEAEEAKNFDVSTFNTWFAAYTFGDLQAAALAERRFRPEYRVAFDAWQATNPATNPDAPPGPSYMPEYKLPGVQEAAKLDKRADDKFAAGQEAAENVDDYVRTTVYLATVLFLVGISGHFRVRGARHRSRRRRRGRPRRRGGDARHLAGAAVSPDEPVNADESGAGVVGESRWPMAGAVLTAMVLTILLPTEFRHLPVWLLPAIEGGLLLAVIIGDPGKIDRRSNVLRAVSIVLVAVLVIAALWATALLTAGLIEGNKATNSAGELLAVGGIVWLSNNIAFALLFWQLDGGGAAARAHRLPKYPDFAFPQQLNPDLAPKNWRPRFVDYLYLGFTNATAFSPTDAMPLAPWAKIAMAIQSLVSLLILGLVIARAVNVFT